MSSLYFFSYNNYYNRIVKGQEYISVQEIIDDTQDGRYKHIVTGDNLAFNPNDYIQTSYNVGSQNNPYIPDCDYVIYSADNVSITSRWYITEQERLMNAQYRLTLVRDVVADYYNEILDAHCYIERATVDNDNPLIFNRENVSFNQIKKREDLLYDKTKTPWIVGYLAQTDGSNPIQWDQGGYYVSLKTYSAGYNYAELSAYSTTPNKLTKNRFKIDALFHTNNGTGLNRLKRYCRYFTSYYDDTAAYSAYDNYGTWFLSIYNSISLNSLKNQIPNKFNAAWKELYKTQFNTKLELGTVDLRQYQDQVCHDSVLNKYYRMNVVSNERTVSKKLKKNEAITETIRNRFLEIDGVNAAAADRYGDDTCQLSGEYIEQYIQFTEISAPDRYGVNLYKNNDQHRIADDAPYYCFAMPYSDANYKLAIEMGTKFGSFCYDIQLVPFCPVQDYYTTAGQPILPLDPDDITEDMPQQYADFVYITSGEEGYEVNSSYLYFVPRTSITFNIDYTINVENKKIENECDMYRLCSPNGSGEYEFNVAMNNGLNGFNVDITYRPISPYIHINPLFGGLYGEDFNDFRGLICGGDFSIPTISNKWIEYQISNKNFQAVFDREIKHQKVTNKYSNIQQLIGAGASAITTGVGVGALINPGVGVMAGLASGIGGAADYAINRKLQKENISYMKDLHAYQLDNVQALPNSIVDTGCKTNNNKLVPYIEYWSCTDLEKELFRQKLYYEGMKIGAYGTIREYLQGDYSFIQADLTRCTTISDDTHVLLKIKEELQIGVYIR